MSDYEVTLVNDNSELHGYSFHSSGHWQCISVNSHTDPFFSQWNDTQQGINNIYWIGKSSTSASRARMRVCVFFSGYFSHMINVVQHHLPADTGRFTWNFRINIHIKAQVSALLTEYFTRILMSCKRVFSFPFIFLYRLLILYSLCLGPGPCVSMSSTRPGRLCMIWSTFLKSSFPSSCGTRIRQILSMARLLPC